MDVKRGSTAIIFDKSSELYFLILHRVSNWKGWEFCKGGLEDNETPEQAILREILEETGLKNAHIRKKLDRKREFTNNGIKHEFDVFLVEASMNVPIRINKKDIEHDTYLWTMKDRVREKLTWDNEKELFDHALEEIKKL